MALPTAIISTSVISPTISKGIVLIIPEICQLAYLMGERIEAVVASEPLWEPKGERIKG
jgi:hypothetical protein